PEVPGDFAGLENCFDTVICLNVLEYLADPAGAVAALRATLKSNGALLILVPQSPGLFGTLDRSLGHRQRFRPEDARGLLESAGFTIETVYSFNKAGAPTWWLYGRFFRSGHINKPVLKIFDKTVWLWKHLDWLLPWPGLSLIVVARKESA